MLVADETVTVYHKTYNRETRLDQWTPTAYQGASWYGKQAASVGDSGLNTADEYTVRIFTGDEISASVGDVLVRGEVVREITGPAQLEGTERFVITAVRDNRRGLPSLYHWRVEGK